MKPLNLIKIIQSSIFMGQIRNILLFEESIKLRSLNNKKNQVVEWYHNALCHQGETCTELSIAQYVYWKNLRKSLHEVCSKCKACDF